MTLPLHLVVMALAVSAVCIPGSCPAEAQSTRQKIDVSLQQKVMREFAGPEALCQEANGTRRCTHSTSLYEIYVRGSEFELFARLYLKELAGEGIEALVQRLLALPPMFGFDPEATRECLKKAFEMSSAGHSTGNVNLANAQFEMVCRSNAPQDLIFELSTKIPVPKSTF